jgi:hypothetical protein
MDIKEHAKRTLNRLRLNWYTSKYRMPGGYRRIYHYHIRKSAGTSLNSAFWSLAGLNLKEMGRRSQVVQNGLIFVRHNPKLIKGGQYFYANSHNPSHRIFLPPKTFTITILRDPLSRLLSYYKYLYYVANNPLAQETEPYYEEVLKQSKCLGSSFESFLNQIPKRDLLNQLHMFSSDYDIQEACDRIMQLSVICFTETFEQDLGSINQKLGLSLQQRRDRSFSQPIKITNQDLEHGRDVLKAEFDLIEKVKSKLNQTQHA